MTLLHNPNWRNGNWVIIDYREKDFRCFAIFDNRKGRIVIDEENCPEDIESNGEGWQLDFFDDYRIFKKATLWNEPHQTQLERFIERS